MDQLMTVEISRGTTHDGPGVRNTVFVKGCPLNCIWCQNPESIHPEQEIWFEAAKCIGCLDCIKDCPHQALTNDSSGIKIDRNRCVACGICTDNCPAKAITFVGTKWSVDDLVHEVTKDKQYYDEFGGGVTVSGGEPLLYTDFLVEFFTKLKESNVHTALDTSGYFTMESLLKLLPHVDLILYDLKLIDLDQHKKYTGKSNELILDNIVKIAKHITIEQFTDEQITDKQTTDKQTINEQIATEQNTAGHNESTVCMKLWIRTPLIPDTTMDEDNIRGLSIFIVEHILPAVQRWELCAFNPMCIAKYRKFQKPWPFADKRTITQSQANHIKDIAISCGIPEDKIIVTGLI